MRIIKVLLFFALVSLCVDAARGDRKESRKERGEDEMTGEEIMNGMVYTCWNTGGYSTPYSDLSVKALTLTKNSWVSVVWTWYQPTISDTTISPQANVSPNETDIVHFVQTAKQLGLNVALKPHVDLSNDASHWRGEIGTGFSQDQWNAWFASYQSFIYYVAGIATQTKADLLIVGTELSVTESQVALWRDTISGVRKNFGGPLVYGANWSPFNVTWWDAVDFIGVDAYFPLTQETNPSVTDLVAGWDSPLALISGAAKKFNKTVIFTEIGYQSVANTASAPYGANGQLNLMAQANCYQAFFTAVYSQPWFQGVFWWAWGVDPNEGGNCDNGYTPHNKPAENVLQKYYSNALDSVTASYVVYKNGTLNSDWQDWSYSGTVSLQSTQVVYPGEHYSLSAALNAWGAVSLHSSDPFSTSGFTSLTFVIAGSSSLSNSIYVSLYDQNGNQIYNLNLENYYSNCTVGSSWQALTVPLSDLFPTSQITRLNFNNFQASNGLFYLDEIYFV